MKKIKYLIFSLFTIVAIASCIDTDNDELTKNAITGGVLSVDNGLISYVVGSGDTYTATGSVLQGNVQTTSIEVYKTFTNSVTESTSGEILLKTVPVDNTTIGQKVVFSLSFTYEELIAGLEIDGSPLPNNDGALNIGDFWQLKYVSKTSEGNTHPNAKTTKVAVGTRYAGVYIVEESAYWNSGSLRGDWNGGERIIESVDATIYRHKGLAYWDDNEFFFTVDNATGVITVLDVDLSNQGVLLNTSPIMTCTGGTGSFESIPCNNTTSLATPDDVQGKDMLEFTVGYFRGAGATREFYEKLIKKVE